MRLVGPIWAAAAGGGGGGGGDESGESGKQRKKEARQNVNETTAESLSSEEGEETEEEEQREWHALPAGQIWDFTPTAISRSQQTSNRHVIIRFKTNPAWFPFYSTWMLKTVLDSPH